VHFNRVWMGTGSTARTAGVLWCGASLGHNTERAVVGWRTLVDRAPRVVDVDERRKPA
jgi:hypothetical protein